MERQWPYENQLGQEEVLRIISSVIEKNNG